MPTTFDPSAPQGALAIVAPFGTLVVTGGDRQSWLNGLVTCDLAKLRRGEGAYGLFTSKVGRILADGVVVLAEGKMIVGCPEGRTSALAESLESYLVMEDAEVSDASAGLAWVLLHGPDAARLAREAASEGLGESASVDITGLGGAALVTARPRLGEALERLSALGAQIGGEGDWEVVRLERAVPSFGRDFDEKTYPQEASLEKRAVSFQKGCYLGQEVICRLEMRGHVHRKLVSLVVDAEGPPTAGAEVTSEAGEKVGQITSAAMSPRLGKPVALAMVKYAAADQGTSLSAGGAPSRVVEVPVSPRGAS